MINQPEAVATVAALHEEYEAALISNDVEKLVGFFWDSEHALRFQVIAHRCNMALLATGCFQILTSLFIRREVAHRRAVLRRHVRDRRAIDDRERRCAFAVKFDKLPDDFRLAQELGYCEH